MTHKLCTSPFHHGARWTPLHCFTVRQWRDTERTVPHLFCSHCRTCERLKGRIRNAKRAGRDEPYGQLRIVRHSPEELAAKAREYRDRWHLKHPEWQREYEATRRRQRGVPAKGSYRVRQERELVAVESFRPLWNEIVSEGNSRFMVMAYRSRDGAAAGRLDTKAFLVWAGLTPKEYKSARAALRWQETMDYLICERVLLATEREHMLSSLYVVKGEKAA